MTLSKYLFEQHILFEFLHNAPNKVSMLYEGRSVVPGIDTILEKIMGMLDAQIYKASRAEIGEKVLNQYVDIRELGLPNLFFDEINFIVKLVKSQEAGYKGSFNIKELKYRGENTKVPLDIDFVIEAPDEREFRRILYFAFGHEITHAYGVWQWVMKNKKDYTFEEFNQKSNYNRFRKQIWDTNNDTAIKNMHYHFSRTEMNAYIAQLRQELLLKKDEITDSKTAMNAIRNTASYQKNYEYLEKNINTLIAFLHSEDKAIIETQKALLDSINYVAKKNFSTYRQAVNYMIQRWRYYQKEYMIKASKIVYDIYSDNNFMFDGCEL